MKGALLSVDLHLESISRLELPVNCEVIARTYVGDVEHALARAPKNRALFLVGPSGIWRLDVAQLMASFAEQARARDRQRELELGIEWPKRLRLATPRRAKKQAS